MRWAAIASIDGGVTGVVMRHLSPWEPHLSPSASKVIFATLVA